MLDKSDLVVIATFETTKDTEERTQLPDLKPSVEVVGMNTNFEALLVFKGPQNIRKFQLHHYRFQDPRQMSFVDAPHLITLPTPPQNGEQSVGHQTFLMFLVKEPDGRYAPVTGQTDPAAFSIRDLTCGG